MVRGMQANQCHHPNISLAYPGFVVFKNLCTDMLNPDHVSK